MPVVNQPQIKTDSVKVHVAILQAMEPLLTSLALCGKQFLLKIQGCIHQSLGDSKPQLWQWKQLIIAKLAELRLRIHPHSAQVTPVKCGRPWLGFVVYPQYRRIKRRKVVNSTRRLTERYELWRRGIITFAEFDAGVQGWINHVRYADSWGLRKHVLKNFKR